jgi:hypothetical protein
LFVPTGLQDAAKPLEKEHVRQAEQLLGVVLPPAYLEVLEVQNGGYLYRKKIRPAQRPVRFWGTASTYELEMLCGLDPDRWDSLPKLLEVARQEWDLPQGLVPFAGDGHFWVCLDYRTCGSQGDPSVTHTITSDFPGKPPKEFLVAESVEALIRGLQRPKPGAGSAYIALDSPRVRGEQLAEIMQKLGCKRHRFSSSKKRPDERVAWTWSKHAATDPKYFPGAMLMIEENCHELGWTRFACRPAKHPILAVQTPLAARAACVIELLIGLGEGATLLAIDSPGWEVPQA